MSEARLIPARESFLPRADARWPAPAITVGYLEPDALHTARVRDTFDVLVPTGSANLFATFRDSQGQERTVLVRAPLVCVVPPGLPHALADQAGTRTLVLAIARTVFARTALAAPDGAEPALREPHAAADPLLRHIGDAVCADVRQQRPFDPRYLEALATVLAMHVARHYAVTAAPGGCAGGLAPHKLQRVREFIAEHLGEPLGVEQLARVAHLSPFHFARMFKQSTGESPHLHVLMQRMERARQLLAGTETALVDVAAEVGFRTQGHFTGVFHRYTGCTPRAFRLNARAAAVPRPDTGAGTFLFPSTCETALNTAAVRSTASALAFELRFEPLFQLGRALAFPCDGEGHVDLERCSRDERTSYLFARAMVGREYKEPRVAPIPEPRSGR